MQTVFINDSDEKLLLALPMLTKSLGKAIAEERARVPFLTWEELSQRVPKLSASVAKKLKNSANVRLSSRALYLFFVSFSVSLYSLKYDRLTVCSFVWFCAPIVVSQSRYQKISTYPVAQHGGFSVFDRLRSYNSGNNYVVTIGNHTY